MQFLHITFPSLSSHTIIIMLTFSSPPHPHTPSPPHPHTPSPLTPSLPPQLLKGVTISQGGVLPHIPEVLLFRKHQLRKMGPSKPKPPTAGPPSPKLPPPPPVKKAAPKTPTKAPPKVSWGRNSRRTVCSLVSLKQDNLFTHCK